jgi:L-aspartate oxidase
MNHPLQYDVLIIGSGAAGLATALTLADNKKIAVISKDDLLAGSSHHAQGGIAAVMDQTTDNIDAHIQDTLRVGDGLCDPDVVAFTVKNAKKAIQWLIRHGVQFTVDPQSKAFHFNQEGGHSQRRIIHAADRTGATIVKTLIEQIFAHPNIHCFSQHTAADLIIQNQHCLGAWVLDNHTQEMHTFYAKETVLACGGASRVYQHTTNPDMTSGDGIGMAWRAGCHIQHMEFNQFHPTCLFYPGEKPFLISEALRGEGGKLTLPNGKAFMLKYDARAELAPRDIVTRAIHKELQDNAIDHVYLDISHQSSNMIQAYFPTIYRFCYQQGIDITQSPIPVVPAAHYTCGGVTTNLNAQTNIPHLYAIGEAACTGLHGANRMASNSLLECLVFSASASQAILTTPASNTPPSTTSPYRPPSKNRNSHATPALHEAMGQLQKLMWKKVGIVRNTKDLLSAKAELQKASQEFNILFERSALTREIIEYRNMIDSAQLITNSALARQENRGLHYNETRSAVGPDSKA